MPVFAKIGSAIKSNVSAISSFFSDSWTELKKVRWPNRSELISYTNVVVITVVIVTVYFWLLDLGFSRVIDWILNK